MLCYSKDNQWRRHHSLSLQTALSGVQAATRNSSSAQFDLNFEEEGGGGERELCLCLRVGRRVDVTDERNRCFPDRWGPLCALPPCPFYSTVFPCARRNCYFSAHCRRWLSIGLVGGHGALLQGETRVRDQGEVKAHTYITWLDEDPGLLCAVAYHSNRQDYIRGVPFAPALPVVPLLKIPLFTLTQVFCCRTPA